MGNFYQGKYSLNHPEKYKGNSSNIVFQVLGNIRLSFSVIILLQSHTGIQKKLLSRMSPMDGRVHRYFMDLKVWIRMPDGTF